MKKQIVKVQIEQLITDAETKETQYWQHETVAEHFILQSFEKIVYQDQQQRKVTVKWYSDDVSRMEFSYDNTTIFLNLEQLTQTQYLTEFGRVELMVQTERVEIRSNKIIGNYKLLLENKTLGDYQFRLIYHV